MKVEEVMTKDVACCGRETSVRDIAVMMAAHNRNAIAVADADGRPVGIVTEHDIVTRALGAGKDPNATTAADCLSEGSYVTVPLDADVETCSRTLEESKAHSAVAVDGEGKCRGIVARDDIAPHLAKREAGAILAEVARPAEMAKSARRALKRGSMAALSAAGAVGAVVLFRLAKAAEQGGRLAERLRSGQVTQPSAEPQPA